MATKISIQNKISIKQYILLSMIQKIKSKKKKSFTKSDRKVNIKGIHEGVTVSLFLILALISLSCF